MNVCVFGLWHLGCVTAACAASMGHHVTGLDLDETTIARLSAGEPPLQEAGLGELMQRMMASGRLRFTTSPQDALRGAEVLWVSFDTPVDEDDRADVDFVIARIETALEHVAAGTVVLISSQLPVGSIRRLEQAWPRVAFASSPENLRLGRAIDTFMKPDRIVVGTRSDHVKASLATLFAPLHARIEWMSIESAEMTKHALNAFLATSVAFINEIATVCEEVGADAHEVARGLKTDARIGPGAYLSPGGAFAGGTLARDVEFLRQKRDLLLIAAVKASNDRHKQWARRKLLSVLGDLRDRTVAVWGLTYKAGTDTLRRSAAIELCRWLIEQRAHVRAYDPMVRSLPANLDVELCATAEEALHGADALVVATEWSGYRQAHIPTGTIVIDANRFLGPVKGVRHYSVGSPA